MSYYEKRNMQLIEENKKLIKAIEEYKLLIKECQENEDGLMKRCMELEREIECLKNEKK